MSKSLLLQEISPFCLSSLFHKLIKFPLQNSWWGQWGKKTKCREFCRLCGIRSGLGDLNGRYISLFSCSRQTKDQIPSIWCPLTRAAGIPWPRRPLASLCSLQTHHAVWQRVSREIPVCRYCFCSLILSLRCGLLNTERYLSVIYVSYVFGISLCFSRIIYNH